MRPDDQGFSLVETMVTMVVMAVVAAIFTTGITQIYATSNATEALTVATTQVHNAFVRLDRSTRYAAGISLPDAAGKYVEFATLNAGVTTCYQLRVVSGQLQTRRQVGTSPTGGWTVLASYLTNGSRLNRVGATKTGQPYQQLIVTLTLTAGTGSSARSSTSSFTYTALNTSPDTTSDTICSAMGRP